jgi:hypothetical protein
MAVLFFLVDRQSNDHDRVATSDDCRQFLRFACSCDQSAMKNEGMCPPYLIVIFCFA